MRVNPAINHQECLRLEHFDSNDVSRDLNPHSDMLQLDETRNRQQNPKWFPRQYLRRTAVAVIEIRMRLLACLGDRIRGEGRRQKVDRLLQSQAPTFRPWRQATRRGLLAEK